MPSRFYLLLSSRFKNDVKKVVVGWCKYDENRETKRVKIKCDVSVDVIEIPAYCQVIVSFPSHPKIKKWLVASDLPNFTLATNLKIISSDLHLVVIFPISSPKRHFLSKCDAIDTSPCERSNIENNYFKFLRI